MKITQSKYSFLVLALLVLFFLSFFLPQADASQSKMSGSRESTGNMLANQSRNANRKVEASYSGYNVKYDGKGGVSGERSAPTRAQIQTLVKSETEKVEAKALKEIEAVQSAAEAALQRERAATAKKEKENSALRAQLVQAEQKSKALEAQIKELQVQLVAIRNSSMSEIQNVRKELALVKDGVKESASKLPETFKNFTDGINSSLSRFARGQTPGGASPDIVDVPRGAPTPRTRDEERKLIERILLDREKASRGHEPITEEVDT